METENDFTEKVSKFFELEGILSLSIDGDNEGFFSWNNCDCCKSKLGGNRFDCSGYNEKAKAIQAGYQVCEDCIQYIYNGELPGLG